MFLQKQWLKIYITICVKNEDHTRKDISIMIMAIYEIADGFLSQWIKRNHLEGVESALTKYHIVPTKEIFLLTTNKIYIQLYIRLIKYYETRLYKTL